MNSDFESQGSSKRVKGERLFTFALVADTHMRSPKDTPSPWKTNELANCRTEFVFNQVAAARPDFIVHLGDVTNPVPHLATFESACDAALSLIKATGLTTYVVPGNHDVGDKCSYILPNHPIDAYSLEQFERKYGPSFQSFDIGNLHLVIVNSSLFGSGLLEESSQYEWLASDLNSNRGKRIFIFSHYPIYMTDPAEPALYDNIELEGRARLLEMLSEYEVEAAFAGHVHNFFYNQYKSTEMYGLMSTTFVRQDYSEMWNASPGVEFGRDDSSKLGWAEVHVYEQGHIVELHRSETPIRQPDGAACIRVSGNLHPKLESRSSLGVHVREAWAESKPLPFSGPQDEFERRRARNDYHLLALWECGLRKLRVPLKDLLDPQYRRRMIETKALGHEFVVFHAGLPTGIALKALTECRQLISAVEIVLPWRTIDSETESLTRFVAEVDLPVFLACAVSPMEHKRSNYQFGYFSSFGFDRTEKAMIEEFHASVGRAIGLGYTFRIGPEQSPLIDGSDMARFAADGGIPVMLNVTSLSAVPELRFDDVAIASRSAEATVLAASSPNISVFVDTLVDVHRGYMPRSALYDGRYNPRLGARVVSNLNSVIHASSQQPVLRNISGGAIGRCTFGQEGKNITLLLPHSEATRNAFLECVLELSREGAKIVGLSQLVELDRSAAADSPDTFPVEPVLIVENEVSA